MVLTSKWGRIQPGIQIWHVQVTWRCMAVREVPKDVLKMASGLISPSGLAGHRRPLCTVSLETWPCGLISTQKYQQVNYHFWWWDNTTHWAVSTHNATGVSVSVHRSITSWEHYDNLRSGYKKTYHALWKNLNRYECIPIWNEFIPELFSTIFHNFYLEWIHSGLEWIHSA